MWIPFRVPIWARSCRSLRYRPVPDRSGERMSYKESPFLLLRHFDDGEEQSEVLNCLTERLVLHRFRDIDVASQFVAPLHFRGVVRGREYDDGDLTGALIVLNDLEHLVAVQNGQVQVEQNDQRGRMRVALVAVSFQQEPDGLLAVIDRHDCVGNTATSQ